jgi:predicted RNA-binding Zn-ribbon protein involved in translation (DUF1610 family)
VAARRRRAAKHTTPARRAGARAEGVALAFARDRDGRLVPARRLDETTRRSRAPFTCPGCGDEVVARLGAQRARHFAHRPGSACPLTAPETALHFNAKQRLLALAGEAFAGTRRVTLLTRCAGCRRPAPRLLADQGDGAVAEGAVGTLRADVLLTRAGAPSLALEVLVTHAVETAKEAALAACGVPAVEIDARDEWEREGPDGSAELVCERSLGFLPCQACRTAARGEADRAVGGEAAEVAELEAYRQRGWLAGGRPANEPSRQPISSTEPLSAAERVDLTRRFRCPECHADSLEWGARLVRHRCPGTPLRPVAWRGYDGTLAELGWWKR